MARDFEIITQPNWFLRERRNGREYELSYRLLICHALFKLVTVMKMTDQAIKDKLDEAIKAIDSKSVLCDESFLCIYPLINELGFSVVDRTRGCYPLILYSDKIRTNGGDRVMAFSCSLKNISNKYNNIIKVLHGNWDENLQISAREKKSQEPSLA